MAACVSGQALRNAPQIALAMVMMKVHPGACFGCLLACLPATHNQPSSSLTPHSIEMVSASCSTLRVWKDQKCIHVLEGHEGAVQCVVYLPSGEVVSGSNDTTIRVWRESKCIHIIKGHTDTVR